MRSSEASSSPSCRSKKPNLRTPKTQSPNPIGLSSKTPEKLPELTRRRTRNRGVALSVADVRKVAESLQDRRKPETTSSQAKTARRQIALPSSSPRKPKSNTDDEHFKLPEKYEILGEFFDSLDSSIRLSKLKGSMPTFTNISPKIECLTDRRFTHGHLAQLKFILPEAIAVKKMLVFDERTSCMKPDLHVSINPDAVESDAKLKPECGTLSMRKLFRARLRDFCKSHPEGDEIPEEILPEPFNHRKQDCLSEIFETHSSAYATVTSSDACAAHPPTLSSVYMQDSDIADNTVPVNVENNLPAAVKTSIEALNLKPAVASHMSQSFRRRFSQKSIENGSDNVNRKLPSDPSQPLSFSGSESNLKKNAPFLGTRSHPKSCTSKLVSEAASSEICPTISASSDCFMPSGAPPATPSKTNEYTETDGSLKSIDAMSTPAKLVSTPSRLMTATPALPPPKRQSSSSLNKLVRRPPRSRSLKFDTPVKNKETENEDYAGGLSIDDDIFDILPENLLQSIREKEIMAMEERDPAISQAKRRQKMVAKLPKLFNMINLLFHSINRSVITKEELVSKIISSHCDIVDRREVEEQLKLLLELVPEWISEKLASSGDFLMCVNKMVNPETIRTSLEEAK